MLKKKFYQNYVVQSKEEAFVILKAHINAFYGGECDGFMNEAICNVFVSEENFGKDKVDNSFCFLVTEEIDKVLDSWINCNNLAEVSVLEGFDSLDENTIVDTLYKKLVGSSDLNSLYEKDLEVFGDDASWYKDDDSVLFVLFRKYWNLEK